MSTVDRAIADQIIGGMYPEDKIVAIIKYSNKFNGADAYKLCYSEPMVDECFSDRQPAIINPTIYWRKPK